VAGAVLAHRPVAQQPHGARGGALPAGVGGEPVADLGLGVGVVQADGAEQPVVGVDDEEAVLRQRGEEGAGVVLGVRRRDRRPARDLRVLAGRDERRDVRLGGAPERDDAVA
jgi:hypothetical protein